MHIFSQLVDVTFLFLPALSFTRFKSIWHRKLFTKFKFEFCVHVHVHVHVCVCFVWCGVEWCGLVWCGV